MWIAPSDRCLVDADILAGVSAIDEAVPVLNGKPFSGPDHPLIFVSGQVDKSVMHFLELSCGLAVRIQAGAFSSLVTESGLDKPALIST